MPGAIFVSYRRATTSNAAGRLADRLMDRFGEEQVFVDVDAIEPGVDFVEVIENAVAACRVLLVVIGPTWHTDSGSTGRRRLDDPHDPVVIEVRTGLGNPAVRVIPVLVEGAQMPQVDDLPPDLQRLARLNAARLEHASFRPDAARLIEVLERVLAAPSPTEPAAPAPLTAEEPILDDFPPPTTSPDLAEARRLEAEATGPDAREQVLAAYRRAIDSGHADAPVAWAELGMFQTNDTGGDNAPAEEALGRAVASGHPTAVPMGWLGLAAIAYIQDDLARAEELFGRLTDSRYRAVAVLSGYILASVLARRRDFAGARAVAERAMELADGEPSSWIAGVADELDGVGDAAGATALLQWALNQPLDESTALDLHERLAKRATPS